MTKKVDLIPYYLSNNGNYRMGKSIAGTVEEWAKLTCWGKAQADKGHRPSIIFYGINCTPDKFTIEEVTGRKINKFIYTGTGILDTSEKLRRVFINPPLPEWDAKMYYAPTPGLISTPIHSDLYMTVQSGHGVCAFESKGRNVVFLFDPDVYTYDERIEILRLFACTPEVGPLTLPGI
jgi:hypothetical protein